MRLCFVAVLAVSFLRPTVASAGGGPVRFAVVNLDQDSGSRRFPWLLERLDRGPGESATELDRRSIAPLVRAGCSLAQGKAFEAWRASAQQDHDFLVLYCSQGGLAPIVVTLYDIQGGLPSYRLMSVEIAAPRGSVGRPALDSLADAMRLLAAKQFRP